LDRGFWRETDGLDSPCESDVLARLDHGPHFCPSSWSLNKLASSTNGVGFWRKAAPSSIVLYFFSPMERFFSLRSDDLHFLQRSALRGFRAPHLRQTWRKSLLFCAICFFVASAMGKLGT